MCDVQAFSAAIPSDILPGPQIASHKWPGTELGTRAKGIPGNNPHRVVGADRHRCYIDRWRYFQRHRCAGKPGPVDEQSYSMGIGMEWNNELRLGIKDIDEQHKILAEIISSIKVAVARDRGWSDLHLAIVRLADYVRIHFAVEESLMRVHDYHRLDEHTDEHRQFSLKLAQLQELSLKSAVTEGTIAFLHEWWDKHIRTSDKAYALHFLKRVALGKS